MGNKSYPTHLKRPSYRLLCNIIPLNTSQMLIKCYMNVISMSHFVLANAHLQIFPNYLYINNFPMIRGTSSFYTFRFIPLTMASLRYLPFLSPDGLEGGGVLGIFGNSRCCSLSILFLFRWSRWLKPTCSRQLILISRLSWSANHLRMIGRTIACRFV